MKSRILFVFLTALGVFILLKTMSYIAWKYFAVNGEIVLTLKVLCLGVFLLIGIGVLAACFLAKFAPAPSDNEIKTVGGAVLGLTFVSGFCLSGMCFPAAALGTVSTVVYLLPTLLAMKLGGYYFGSKRK